MRGILVATVLLAGCYQPVVPFGVRCSLSGDCPEGQQCDQVRNLCAATLTDASSSDVPDDVPGDVPTDVPTDTPMIDAPMLGAWGAPQLLTALNTANIETDPAISSDGLELFFASNRPGGPGGQDMYLTTRASTAAAFGAPVLVPELSSTGTESSAHLTADDLTIYFMRSNDIYRATRATRLSPFGTPVLDSELSSAQIDVNPAISKDGLMACITRQLTASDRDLYLYVRASTGASWGTGQLMTALQTTLTDSGAEFTTDPLEMYFHTDRTGATDIYRATRATPSAMFGSPVAVTELNTTLVLESDPSVSADRRIMVFERGQNLVMATR